MKDGTIFTGELLEKMDDNSYRVKTSKGREMIFPSDQVKRIEIGEGYQEGLELEEYGGKYSVGISLLGGSFAGGNFFGGHYRNKLQDELFLDLGIHYSLIDLDNSIQDEVEFDGRVSVSLGLNYFLSRYYKEKKEKLKAHGLFLSSTYAFGTYDTTILGFGWVMENFKRNRYSQSFVLELGPSLMINHWVDDPDTFPYNIDAEEVEFNLHLRLLWNFFLDGRQ